MPVDVRPVTVDDAAAMAASYARNREFLAPFDPVREDRFFTEEGQRAVLEQLDADRERGAAQWWAIESGGALVGRITLTNISRGPSQSGNVGYWIDQAHNGRGLASAALQKVLAEAFGPFGLHRVEAATLIDNVASQRVLAGNGFTRIGIAPAYLRIAGRWQDHVLFQRIAPQDVGPKS